MNVKCSGKEEIYLPIYCHRWLCLKSSRWGWKRWREVIYERRIVKTRLYRDWRQHKKCNCLIISLNPWCDQKKADQKLIVFSSTNSSIGEPDGPALPPLMIGRAEKRDWEWKEREQNPRNRRLRECDYQREKESSEMAANFLEEKKDGGRLRESDAIL